jgi:hypothetical protein
MYTHMHYVFNAFLLGEHEGRRYAREVFEPISAELASEVIRAMEDDDGDTSELNIGSPYLEGEEAALAPMLGFHPGKHTKLAADCWYAWEQAAFHYFWQEAYKIAKEKA